MCVLTGTLVCQSGPRETLLFFSSTAYGIITAFNRLLIDCVQDWNNSLVHSMNWLE